MAAFSSLPLDSSSLLLPNTPAIDKLCALFEEPANYSSNSTPSFSQIPHPENPKLHHKNCTMDSSSEVTDKYDGGGGGAQKAAAIAIDRKRKCRKGTSVNSAQSKDKRKHQKKMKGDDQEKKGKEEKEAGEEAPKGYIHVRARRGQATDSHSLAERIRRERISERMKLLQALVPGCDKVTGKALMLDEIINYVQSLQNQVEFLSMKLASVNPMSYDFGMDLEPFMVRPDQDLNPFIQESSLPANNNFQLLENSANSIIFPQPQNPSDLISQGSRQGLWEMDEQRQKIINNQAGFSINSMFSFH